MSSKKYKNFDPNRETQYSDYNYKNANKLINPFDTSQMVNGKDFATNSLNVGSYPLNSLTKLPTATNSSTTQNTSFWAPLQNLDAKLNNAFYNSKFMKSGLGKFINRIGQSGAEINGANVGDKNFKEDSTGNKAADTIANIAGAGMGLIFNPIGGVNAAANKMLTPVGDIAEKGANNLVGKIGQSAFKNASNPTTYNVITKAASYLPTMARAGAEQGLQGAGIELANGGNVKDIAKEGLVNAGQGVLFSGALKGLGDLGHSAFKTNVTVDRQQLNNPRNVLKPLDTNTPLTENNLLNNEVASLNNSAKPNNNLNGDFTKVNDLNVPEVTPTNKTKLRKFTQTVKNSDIATQELKDKLPNQKYNTITNEDTVTQAQKIINADKDTAKSMVMSDEPATATTNTMAQLLAKQAQDEGNYTDAIAIIQKTSEKATKAGQAIQALSIWNKLTPEGMLKFANQTFQKANMTLPKNKQINMTEDIAKDITDKMTEIAKMPEGYDKTVETQKVLKGIANKIPSSNLKKIDTFQTMAQLLNPKTSIRNILGNAGMQLNENLSNIVGTGVDKGVSLITGKRTVGMPSFKTQLQGFKEGAQNSINDIKNGVSMDNTQFDLPNSQVFDNNKLGGKILNKGQKVLDYMLKTPDEATKTAIRNDSLRTQMKLAGVTTPTDEMLQIAENDAKYGTFQDSNAVSQAFSNVKKALNGGKEFGLGSMLMKYPKTPANILMRSIDSSPIGFFKAAYRLAEPVINGNDFNQRDFVKSTSRALVGTGNLIGAGYIFNKLGIITGKSNTDTDTANMQKQTGLGDYKLNLSALKRFVASGFDPNAAKIQKGDNLINYDWLQPSSIGLAIGANAADKNKNGTDALTTVMDSLNSGMNTLAQQPLVSGLTNFFGQGKQDIGKALTSTLKGVPSSLIPTIFKQVAQLSDNTTRSTYDPNWQNQMVNMVKSKIPGLSQTLQPKLDSLGNEQKAFQNNNPFNVFLNPAFNTKYNPTQAAQLPLDIFNNTGNVTSMPRQTPTYIMNGGKRINLTPQEATDFQRNVGQKTQQALDMLGNAPADDNTAKQIQNLMTAIQANERDNILNNRGISTQKTKQTSAEKAQSKFNTLQKKNILNRLGIH